MDYTFYFCSRVGVTGVFEGVNVCVAVSAGAVVAVSAGMGVCVAVGALVGVLLGAGVDEAVKVAVGVLLGGST